MLPLDTAKAVWFALSAAALVVLLPLSVALLPHRRQPMWLLIGVLLLGLGKYYAEDLVLGQINTLDRKSTRLNSSHLVISYAVFCLKNKIAIFYCVT